MSQDKPPLSVSTQPIQDSLEYDLRRILEPLRLAVVAEGARLLPHGLIAFCWQRGDDAASCARRSLEGWRHDSEYMRQGHPLRLPDLDPARLSAHARLRILRSVTAAWARPARKSTPERIDWSRLAARLEGTGFDAIDIVLREAYGFTGARLVLSGVALDGLPVWSETSFPSASQEKRGLDALVNLDTGRETTGNNTAHCRWRLRVTPSVATSCPIAIAAGREAMIVAPSASEALRRWHAWRTWTGRTGRALPEVDTVELTPVDTCHVPVHPF